MSCEGGSLCTVYKMYELPLYIRGHNVASRRVGVDKSGGEQGLCPFMELRVTRRLVLKTL